MSNEDTAPTATFDLSAATGSERHILDAFLDYHRQVIVRKVHGVPDDKAKQRLVGSLTTLGGLLKHLAVAEREWFQSVLGQRSAERIGANTSAAPTRGWRVADEETVADLIAEYQRACAQLAARSPQRYHLDQIVPHAYLGQVSLRWIYVHMIEETARHAATPTSSANRPTASPVTDT